MTLLINWEREQKLMSKEILFKKYTNEILLIVFVKKVIQNSTKFTIIIKENKSLNGSGTFEPASSWHTCSSSVSPVLPLSRFWARSTSRPSLWQLCCRSSVWASSPRSTKMQHRDYTHL